jgi:hypothetical protein
MRIFAFLTYRSCCFKNEMIRYRDLVFTVQEYFYEQTSFPLLIRCLSVSPPSRSLRSAAGQSHHQNIKQGLKCHKYVYRRERLWRVALKLCGVQRSENVEELQN